jgi:hypothetical protein
MGRRLNRRARPPSHDPFGGVMVDPIVLLAIAFAGLCAVTAHWR